MNAGGYHQRPTSSAHIGLRAGVRPPGGHGERVVARRQRWHRARAPTRRRRHRPRRRVLPGDHAIGLFASPMARSGPGMFGGLMGGLAGSPSAGCWAPCCSAVWAGASAAVSDSSRSCSSAAPPSSCTGCSGRVSSSPRPRTLARGAYNAGSWSSGGGGTTTVEAPPSVGPRPRARAHPGHGRELDPAAFAEFAKSTFTDVRAGIVERDLGAVQGRLTPQQYARPRPSATSFAAHGGRTGSSSSGSSGPR